MHAYDHRNLEKKWQKEWTKKKLYVTKDRVAGKKNFYLLVEFPYPSGNLHVGHWYAFAVPDIVARHYRMLGRNVMYPIGFDAFGLPAENAAIKNNLNPKKWTKKNIAYMTKQIESMGTSFDWSRKVETIDPSYYKWTQWLFLQFFKKGLAYRKETAVNWCPKDKTVLANEQVVSGRCERCDSEVEQRKMLQWNLKITDYADRLADDLAPLDWPEQIKDSQRNWIGRSEGAEIDFPLAMDDAKRVILLHGKGGTSDGAFKPWLKDKLEKFGYEVQTPQLPNAGEPNDEEQADFVEKHCTLDEQTVVVGHSFGGLVALRLAERGHKFKRIALVGTPFTGEFLDSRPRPTVTAAIKRGFDFERIKKNAGFVLLYDTHDHAIPTKDGDAYHEKLGGYLMKTQAETSHFNGAVEPEVFRATVPAIRVFTTRPDTLFGATYMVLSPEHPWVQMALQHTTVLKNNDEVQKYVTAAGKKTELERQENREKTGVTLEGVAAINPATNERIPIFVADYVLAHYGTGAIMAVPAHDERDFEFAKVRNLPIRSVIDPTDDTKVLLKDIKHEYYVGGGRLINSAEFSGMKHWEAQRLITEKFGTPKKTYKMRDWVVSRQRYWGVPIPIIHCPKCGDVAVPDKDLPVKLPEVKDYLPTGDGKSPLAKVKKFVNVKCPQCKGKAERETDTFDTFVDSSWYFQRYTDPINKKKFADAKKLGAWMPVDLYSGGAEHTTMHVLYSRFWQKAMYDLGLVKDSEPYTRRMNRSLIMGPDGQKMSKSRGNVIDPDEVVRNLGADTVRLYLAFIGPYNEVASYPWNPDGVVGVRRFLERVWRLAESISSRSQRIDEATDRLVHQTIKKVGEDVAALKLNTAISQLMILLNAFEKQGVTRAQYEVLLKLLAPFAPHMTEELWRTLGNRTSIHTARWPAYNARRLASDTVTIVVQVNGKVRAQFLVPRGSSQDTVEQRARTSAAQWITDVRKVIFIPDRLINLVG